MKNIVLNIPIDLAGFVFTNKLRTSFKLYVCLKAVSSGKLHEDSNEFKFAIQLMGIKDKRTLKKHLQTLVKLNWVGYNGDSGYYFIRSLTSIRVQQSLKGMQAVRCDPEKDLKNFDSFLFAAAVGARVKRFEYWVRRERWKGRFATNKRGVANHNLLPNQLPPKYYGLSAASMAKMLGLSRTSAVELKNKAVECGYLQCNHKYQDYATLDCPDSTAKRMIRYTDPDIMNKLKVYPTDVDGKAVIKFMQQLHDEVIPNLEYRSIRSRNKPTPFRMREKFSRSGDSVPP